MQAFCKNVIPYIPSSTSLRCIRLVLPYSGTRQEWQHAVSRDASVVCALFERLPALQTLEIGAPYTHGIAGFVARLRVIEEMWNEELGTRFEGRVRLMVDEQEI
jgi:hypothetical protein